jgi:hypothetical protein
MSVWFVVEMYVVVDVQRAKESESESEYERSDMNGGDDNVREREMGVSELSVGGGLSVEM